MDNFLEILTKVIAEQVNDSVICKETENVYNKFSNLDPKAPESIKEPVFTALRNFALSLLEEKRVVDSLLIYKLLIEKSAQIIVDFSNIAQILAMIGYHDFADKFIEYYKKNEENKPLLFITLGNFYNFWQKDYKKAIISYEKYLEIDQTKPVVYTILANLYEKVYGTETINTQIELYKKALDLKSDDRLAIHGLAFGYERLKDPVNAKKYYELLLKNNPTNTDYYNYGCFLIQHGDFKNGFEYFAKRNLIESETFKNSITNTQELLNKLKTDLSDKTLLVKYEQGFGDTIMFCRFLPELKAKCKKLIFVTQDETLKLMKSSFKTAEGIEIISQTEFENNCPEFDTGMMLLDSGYVLGCERILPSKGYLCVDDSKIKNYGQKYLKNNRFKIGISWSGDKNSNYGGRNFELKDFGILKNLDNVQIYSLQKDYSGNCEWIVSLGETFEDFTDSACAIKNMDMVVSTDNVILNLAGALGVKCAGLYSYYPNFRWFKLDGEDCGWYKSVKPFVQKFPDKKADVINDVYEYLKLQIEKSKNIK